MNCKYRHINSCRICNFRCKEGYCNLHINNRNYIYDIIYNSIGTIPIKSSNEIFQIFSYIYDNPVLTKELIFKKLLLTLINKKQIYLNLYPYLDFFNKNLKMIIDDIFKLNYNSYIIIKNQKDKMNRLKIYIQKYLIMNHYYKDNLILTNDTDAFTLDNLKEINKNEIFIYNDGLNNYFFRAIEFKYFLETNGNWNPYTKKPIKTRIVKNLDIFIKINNLINKNRNDRFNWLSINQAYTDVSQALEKLGFYNNSEWFLKLTPKQIKNIINLFKVMSSRIDTYFLNIDDNNIFFDFAKEIIRLFEDGNTNFLDCCIFMKSIAVYSNDFYNSLPSWIGDIETPLIVVDNSNIFYLLWNDS